MDYDNLMSFEEISCRSHTVVIFDHKRKLNATCVKRNRCSFFKFEQDDDYEFCILINAFYLSYKKMIVTVFDVGEVFDVHCTGLIFFSENKKTLAKLKMKY